MGGVAVSEGATAVTVPRKPWVRTGLTPLALAVPPLADCNSGRASGLAQVRAAFSQKVMGVLADGPDPDADPLGYALSQIAPLDQIHASDPALQRRLSNLLAADRAPVGAHGGDHAAARSIAKDDTALNKDCPGVAS